MKIITILSALIISILPVFGQESEIGSKLAGIQLKQIQSEALIDYDFPKKTEGKIVLIEFWETWCGPCIDGMQHLKVLKNKFHNQLIIICVSSDKLGGTISFINKNDFPFDFIYDKEKLLSNVFPHSGIPHTILVDKDGKIQAETYPGFISDEKINELTEGKDIKIPTKQNFDTEDLNRNNLNTLISFELFRHQLGDRQYIDEYKNENKPIQIVTGYSGNAFVDTLETINGFISAGKNILDLYQFAFGNIRKSRFIFNSDLNFINSKTPNNLYRANFSCSSLLGEYKSIFIQQLNSIFGLNAEIIEKEVSYFELTKIDQKKDIIIPAGMFDKPIRSRITQSFNNLEIKDYLCNALQIANLIEDQIVHLQSNKYYDQEDKKIYYPVVTNLTQDYVLNMSIQDESSSLERWIELFRENGLTLVEKKGMIKYVKIEKAAHNK